MLGKKSSEKSKKKRFLYSHEYRDQKKGEKRAKQFFRNTRIVHSKMLGKNRRKKCEKTFFIFTRISLPKNAGKKRAKQFFQKMTNC